MTNLPSDLKYAPTHEWVSVEEDQIVRVGITDFAQEQLGDLVYIQLPEMDRKLSENEQCAVVESVKTASDVHAPVAGTVVEVNEALRDSPESLNTDPYGTWLVRVEAAPDALSAPGLLDAAAYAAAIG